MQRLIQETGKVRKREDGKVLKPKAGKHDWRSFLVEEIKQWVEDFVSVKHETLNVIPCPFAKQALMNNTIKYVSTERIGETLTSMVDDWSDKYEVVVLYTDTELYTPQEVSDIVERFNKLAMSRDIVALEDHPDDPEILNGVEMNFGKAILVLVQRLSKLNKASDILKKRGYYDTWSLKKTIMMLLHGVNYEHKYVYEICTYTFRTNKL